jgi:4-amino-4-deoxy-L-arabinose transferase-like glycosyltransferase
MLTRSFRRFLFVALGIVILTLATRLPSLLHPWAIDDEAIYSVVANEIVDGGQPYVDAVERKPPLLFWTYAAIFDVAGKFNWKALHLVALIWTLATMAGLYVIGRQLFDRATGLIAALLYSVFQPWAVWQNLAFNGELMMNLPIVWAWAIAFRRSSSRLRPEMLIAGALLCAGFLLKQPAAIAAVPLGIYLLLPGYRANRGLSRANSFTHAVMLAAGFFGTLGLVTLLLWKQGILGDAFYWTIANHSSPHFFLNHGILLTLAFVGACLPLVIGAALAFRDKSGIWAGKSTERIALFGLVIASAIGATAGGRFYPHYYIQLIPALVLLAAPHFAQLWSTINQSHHWLLRPTAAYTWIALTIIAFSISHWYGLASQRESTETGRYLSAHSAPDDRIFVWGQTTKIYLESRRRPASRYVATFPLTGYVFGSFPDIDTRKWSVPGAWEKLEEDFNTHPPSYIVVLQVPAKNARYPVKDFPILAKLLADRYHPVARTAEGAIYQASQ